MHAQAHGWETVTIHPDPLFPLACHGCGSRRPLRVAQKAADGSPALATPSVCLPDGFKSARGSGHGPIQSAQELFWPARSRIRPAFELSLPERELF